MYTYTTRNLPAESILAPTEVTYCHKYYNSICSLSFEPAESILTSTEDIRRMIPAEASLFDRANASFTGVTAALALNPIATTVFENAGRWCMTKKSFNVGT